MSYRTIEDKTHWVESWQQNKDVIPFDRKKDAVIIGRGSQNRARFFFDLKKVNLFYLNHTPANWMIDVYIDEFGFSPGEIQKSIFTFAQAAHYEALKKSKKIHNSIISWHGRTLPGVLTQNNLPTCADFLGAVLKEKYIYLAALDFDNPDRKFTAERDGMKVVISNRGCPLDRKISGRNRYIFLTPNRIFHNYMPPVVCQAYVDTLKANKTIIKEVLNG